MKNIILPALCFLMMGSALYGQPDFYKDYAFSKADSLKGMLSAERTCYDVKFYDLNLAVDVNRKFIKGYVDIFFKTTEALEVLQIDLAKDLKITEISISDLPLTFHRLFDAVYVHFPMELPKNFAASIRVYYEGFPSTPQDAPSESGFFWGRDKKGNPWAGATSEGSGASAWWPCKDHSSDKPDSMAIHIAVQSGLAAIANGQLRKTERLANGYNHYYWFIAYPVAIRSVSVNIGRYVHFGDVYNSPDGEALTLNYYVLTADLNKTQKYFGQVKSMLACYERLLGKYPFWQDGYTLIQSPHPDMEYQSKLIFGDTYSRDFPTNKLPKDVDWNNNILHESANDYFGNAATATDPGDLWIQESLATYLEAMYVECRYGAQEAARYLNRQRSFIRNLEPVTGPCGVNWHTWVESDHYFKGAWMLHSLRNALDNDELFFGMIRGFYERYKFSTCSTADFSRFASEFTGRDLSRFFDQYLNYTGIPKFAYELISEGRNLKIRFKWEAEVAGFDMPLKVGKKGQYQMIYPVTDEVREAILPNTQKSQFTVPTDLFYIKKKGI